MKSGASVALSGLTGATSAIPLAAIVKPYIVALAGLQAQRGIQTGMDWVDAVTQLLVILLGGIGMWLRLRVLNSEHPTS